MTDILCVNESEAQIILGREEPIETENDIEDAMKKLLKKCQRTAKAIREKFYFILIQRGN